MELIMKSQAMNIKSLFTLSTLALLMVVTMLAIPASAQKLRSGVKTTLAPTAVNPNIDQCANGQAATAPPAVLLPCTGNNWKNGDLNANNSQYVEGDSVSYRAVYTAAASSVVNLTISYDTTKSGKHAIDYLTTYDRTNTTGNDPCNGVTGVSCSSHDVATIPIDPDIVNPTGAAGNFS